MKVTRLLSITGACALALSGAACSSSSTPAAVATTYTVGGNVTGLSGTVVLQNNLADDKSIAGDGAFTFTTALADAAAYSVTVLTQPAGQTCTLTNASGTIASANVSNVAVTCAAPVATSDNTKIAAAAAVSASKNAASNAASVGAETLPSISAKVSKTISTVAIGMTCSSTSPNCANVCGTSGSALVTGDMTADKTGTVGVGVWSLNDISAPLTIVFSDCVGPFAVGGTTYTVTLNGTVTSTLTGHLSGTDGTYESVAFAGTLAGTPTLSGDVTGTVDLANTTYSTVTTPEEITCAGTADVTITGDALQVCSVATDCLGCSL